MIPGSAIPEGELRARRAARWASRGNWGLALVVFSVFVFGGLGGIGVHFAPPPSPDRPPPPLTWAAIIAVPLGLLSTWWLVRSARMISRDWSKTRPALVWAGVSSINLVPVGVVDLMERAGTVVTVPIAQTAFNEFAFWLVVALPLLVNGLPLMLFGATYKAAAESAESPR